MERVDPAVFSVYTPPALPQDEAARDAAVLATGVLERGASLRVQNLTWAAALTLGMPMAAVSIISGSHQTLIATAGLEEGVTLRSTSFCGHAILTPGEVTCIPDALADDRFAGNPAVVGAPHIRFYAGAPLLTAAGHAIGTLCVMAEMPRPCCSAEERGRLIQLARAIMQDVQSGR